MGIIHNILASFLKWLLAPLMYLINGAIALLKGEFSNYNHNIAYTKDLYGNILMQYVFNILFLKKSSTFLYGTVTYDNRYFTISHITAFNYYMNTLTPFGMFFAKILIFFKDKSFTR